MCVRTHVNQKYGYFILSFNYDLIDAYLVMVFNSTSPYNATTIARELSLLLGVCCGRVRSIYTRLLPIPNDRLYFIFVIII